MPNHGGVLKEALLPSKMGTNNGSNSKLLESRPSSKTRLLHHSELERKTTTLEAAMAAVAATKTGQLPILKKQPLRLRVIILKIYKVEILVVRWFKTQIS